MNECKSNSFSGGLRQEGNRRLLKNGVSVQSRYIEGTVSFWRQEALILEHAPISHPVRRIPKNLLLHLFILFRVYFVFHFLFNPYSFCNILTLDRAVNQEMHQCK